MNIFSKLMKKIKNEPTTINTTTTDTIANGSTSTGSSYLMDVSTIPPGTYTEEYLRGYITNINTAGIVVTDPRRVATIYPSYTLGTSAHTHCSNADYRTPRPSMEQISALHALLASLIPRIMYESAQSYDRSYNMLKSDKVHKSPSNIISETSDYFKKTYNEDMYEVLQNVEYTLRSLNR